MKSLWLVTRWTEAALLSNRISRAVLTVGASSVDAPRHAHTDRQSKGYRPEAASKANCSVSARLIPLFLLGGMAHLSHKGQ